jgi:Lon-like protease
MRRRTVSGIGAFCLLVVLFVVAGLLPVPYVTMSPGPTVNVLGEAGGKPIIAVHGQKIYHTKGQLRLTTVSVTSPNNQVHLAEALRAWVDRTRAVYPRDVIYPPQQSVQDAEQESSVQMVSSQDTAIAAALTRLGYRLPMRVEVLGVTKGAPADGNLKARDRIIAVNGKAITDVRQVSKEIQRTGAGVPARFVVRRAGAIKHIAVTPAASGASKKAVVGIEIGTGYTFPFDVSVRLDESIGGPSAGLIFSLGVYDLLTPGALTGGAEVAGTGTITEHGHVGPIGGIQQKIVAAAAAGAKVFLVPAGNCASARGADVNKDEIELVKTATMRSAIRSLRAYAKNPAAELPSCG